MIQKTRVSSLGDISDVYAKSILNESADESVDQTNAPLKVGDVETGELEGPQINSDLEKNKTEDTDGYQEVELDPKKVDEEEENMYDVNDYSTAAEGIEQSVEKSDGKAINNGMSKKKTQTTFDKLFEDVMGDEAMELGIETNAGSEGDNMDINDDNGDLGEDKVTVELSKDLAKELCDVLQAVIGDDEGDLEDTVEDDPFNSDDDDSFGEATEAQTLPSQHGGHSGAPSHGQEGKKQDGGDKTSSLAGSGTGDSSYTDDVGNDTGTKPEAPKGAPHSKQAGNKGEMKAKAGKKNNPGDEAFGQ